MHQTLATIGTPELGINRDSVSPFLTACIAEEEFMAHPSVKTVLIQLI